MKIRSIIIIALTVFLFAGCQLHPNQTTETTELDDKFSNILIDSQSIDLFANVEFKPNSSEFTVLDVSSDAFLVSISDRLPGHPEQFFGVGCVSTVCLLSADDGSLQMKWVLSEEKMECSNGVITEDGVILFCREADETFQNNVETYQIRYYKDYGDDYKVLRSGTCERTGKIVLLDENTLLYTVHEKEDGNPVLIFHLISSDGENIYSTSEKLQKLDILEDQVSVRNGEFLYSVLYFGGAHNTFFRGSREKKPATIRFSKTDRDPVECVRIADRFLTLTNEQKTDGNGVLSFLRLYTLDGTFLSELTYGESAFTNGFVSLSACENFGLTRIFDNNEDGEIIPIVIEEDVPVLMDSCGNGSYKDFFAKRNHIYAYSTTDIQPVSCEMYQAIRK